MDRSALNGVRLRVEQCRRLALLTQDPKMAQKLNKWADDLSADIERLKVENPSARG
jgi:hypothetical protein